MCVYMFVCVKFGIVRFCLLCFRWIYISRSMCVGVGVSYVLAVSKHVSIFSCLFSLPLSVSGRT